MNDLIPYIFIIVVIIGIKYYNDIKLDEYKKNIIIKRPYPSKKMYLRRHDRLVLEDDLTEPTKRLQYYQYPNSFMRKHINISTHGYKDDFHMVGILVRQNDEKVMQLFGRQKYPSSDQWEYYVIGKDINGQQSKIPISNKKEIYDNDSVDVKALDESKGSFTANIYDYDEPRYNPYDY